MADPVEKIGRSVEGVNCLFVMRQSLVQAHEGRQYSAETETIVK